MNKEAALDQGCLGLMKNGAINNPLVHEVGGLGLFKVLSQGTPLVWRCLKGCLSLSDMDRDHI